jgi:hypothetical protein
MEFENIYTEIEKAYDEWTKPMSKKEIEDYEKVDPFGGKF